MPGGSTEHWCLRLLLAATGAACPASPQSVTVALQDFARGQFLPIRTGQILGAGPALPGLLCASVPSPGDIKLAYDFMFLSLFSSANLQL